jgi:hypothetical protein
MMYAQVTAILILSLLEKKKSSVWSQYLRLDQTETETLFGSVWMSKPKTEVHTDPQL